MNDVIYRRKKRKQRANLISNIIFCLIALTALTGCIVLLLQNYMLKTESVQTLNDFEVYKAEKEDYIYTQTDFNNYILESSGIGITEGREGVLSEIKNKMNEGVSTVEILRQLYTDDVVVYADGKYNFFPISDKLKKHDYVLDNFLVNENNQIEYVNDLDEVVSKKGIDVSRYQEKINWEKVADDGVEYAFIRAGVRGSTEGKLLEDANFEANIEGALENNINVGVYFFSQAVSEKEAVEEAELVLEMIEPYDIKYPVVYDLEEVTSSDARTKNLTKEEYTKNCIAFCETIKEAGYTPMIYGNLKTFMIMLDMEQIEQYEKWFAYYNPEVYFPYEFSVWQYTSEGTVNGIKGDVDLNICMKNYK